MNFGVTLSNLVNIDIDARAFDAKTGEMSDELDKGLKTLVATIAKTPSVVRLTYHVTSTTKASVKLADDRLEMIEDRLRELWRGRARYKLNLEITIVGPNGEEQ